MPLILGTNSIKDTGFNVPNSLRFNPGSDDYLNVTQSSGTSDIKGTFSAWIKGNHTNSIFSGHTDSNNRIALYFSDSLRIYGAISGSQSVYLITNQLFRDSSAWYHIVVAWDTSQATDTNRFKVYVNGSQVTSFSTAAYPDEDADVYWNKGTDLTVGARYVSSVSDFFDGYMSETVFIDGLQLAADSFGEFDEDSGIWKPINVSGLTFGTNGFYLETKGSGTSANSSGLGADTSGNANHFTVNNLTAVDQTTDTCTNNFATVNPVDSGFKVNLSEGNLKFVGETADYIQQWGRTTFGVSRGKWYWEMTKIANNPCIGIVTMQSPINLALENNTDARCVIYCSGQLDGQDNSGRVNGIATSIADYADDDIVSCMMDLDNGFVYFAKNGTIQIGADDSTTGNPASGSSGTGAANPTSQLLTNQHDGVWSPLIFDNSSNPAATAIYNFGNPTVALSSGVADGNGFGNFEYAPPSGYFALCTKNLAEHG